MSHDELTEQIRADGLNDEIDRWHELPESVQDGFRRLSGAGTLGDVAILWAAASAPRDYTTSPRDAVHATAKALVDLLYFPDHAPRALAMAAGRRLVAYAAEHHRFCVEPVIQAGLSGEGPYLCGAPLAEDGSCPARNAHRTVLAQGDRDRELKAAKSALHRAVREQARTGEPDVVFELVQQLEEQTARTIALIEHLKENG